MCSFVFDLHTHVGTVHVKKVANTVYRFCFHVPFRFNILFTVLPLQVQTIERAVIAGEDLEILKLVRYATLGTG